MGQRTNPFEELYVSETIPPREFVQLFSDFLVPHALPLFQPGNVVLRGIQGSGKSMLLSLLKPSIRAAYAEADVPFPVPTEHSRFVGAGINLRRSGAINFGQRPMEADPEQDAQQFPLYFGDFLNYWIVADLLEALQVFAVRADGKIARELGLNMSRQTLDEFAVSLAGDQCWFGALEDVKTIDALLASLRLRLRAYLTFLNYNSDDLQRRIRATKTIVGAPISAAARHLRETGVLPSNVSVFIQVDQYEELTHLAQVHGDLGGAYRRIVNRALGQRDQHVSYRIGARRWAWPEELVMFGTSALLEREREYTEVNLDEILRRRENAKTYIFPRFAEDVMFRRLRFANFDTEHIQGPLLRRVFGDRLAPDERARMYVRQNAGCAPDRIVNVSDLPPSWKNFLLHEAEADPLSARLAEAWSRQERGQRLVHGPPQRDGRTGKLPWEREYWRKERREQALMQLAAGCGQRMIWAGADDILALCGGNILIFVSMCRQIWSAHIRSLRDTSTEGELGPLPVPSVNQQVQSVGIEDASLHWYRKTPEQPGGHTRQRFLDVIARVFQRKLLDDRAMSYPGHNGFSLAVADLEADPVVRGFLRDAVDYGDLVEVPHTTKEKDRRPRFKWYLKPVLSPHYRLPAVHVKEPMYLTIDDIREWILLAHSGGGAPDLHTQKRSAQMSLSFED